ncbi:1,6-anhydro-N-acetylmuramyl-L-alanine amidase AmpD [Oceaniserpentilla sp. 4NH20-0058]|uniref:1,6-anhydro-N-acetylmuramyl-L-alanine amidase AmpD n=1 Tax=Oceaniserpentilla sp. 4NH20-0058 TaxID=3127660 RepID=UPI0033422827
MKVIDHKISEARWLASPNFNERPSGAPINMLVVHNISLPPKQFDNSYIEDFFCNRLDCSAHPYFEEIKDLQVSAHVLIKRSGEMVQFVPFNQRAWHAGVSEFSGETNCNDFSIGVELEGTDDIPYTEQQYYALSQLTLCLCEQYPHLTQERIVGHCNIAPQRKTDPGPSFDWSYFKQLLKKLPS